MKFPGFSHIKFTKAQITYFRSLGGEAQNLRFDPSDFRIIKMMFCWMPSHAYKRAALPKLTIKVAKNMKIDLVIETGITLFLVLFL